MDPKRRSRLAPLWASAVICAFAIPTTAAGHQAALDLGWNDNRAVRMRSNSTGTFGRNPDLIVKINGDGGGMVELLRLLFADKTLRAQGPLATPDGIAAPAAEPATRKCMSIRRTEI